MKLPLNVLVGFAPRNVPEALLPVMKFEPRRTRVEVELCGGRPATWKSEEGAVVPMPTKLEEFIVIALIPLLPFQIKNVSSPFAPTCHVCVAVAIESATLCVELGFPVIFNVKGPEELLFR